MRWWADGREGSPGRAGHSGGTGLPRCPERLGRLRHDGVAHRCRRTGARRRRDLRPRRSGHGHRASSARRPGSNSSTTSSRTRGFPPGPAGTRSRADDYPDLVAGRTWEDAVSSLPGSRGGAIPDGSPADGSGEWTAFGLAARQNELFEKLLGNNPVRAFPGTVDLLGRLKAGRIPVVLATSARNADATAGRRGTRGRLRPRHRRADGPGPRRRGKTGPRAAAGSGAPARDPARPGHGHRGLSRRSGSRAARRLRAGRRHRPGRAPGTRWKRRAPTSWLKMSANWTSASSSPTRGCWSTRASTRRTKATARRSPPWATATWPPGAPPRNTAPGTCTIPGSYLAGVYNSLHSVVLGQETVDEHMVNIPDWLPLDLRIGDGAWWSEGGLSLRSERRTLDLKRAVLTREALLEDDAGRQLQLLQRRLVSMADTEHRSAGNGHHGGRLERGRQHPQRLRHGRHQLQCSRGRGDCPAGIWVSVQVAAAEAGPGATALTVEVRTVTSGIGIALALRTGGLRARRTGRGRDSRTAGRAAHAPLRRFPRRGGAADGAEDRGCRLVPRPRHRLAADGRAGRPGPHRRAVSPRCRPSTRPRGRSCSSPSSSSSTRARRRSSSSTCTSSTCCRRSLPTPPNWTPAFRPAGCTARATAGTFSGMNSSSSRC